MSIMSKLSPKFFKGLTKEQIIERLVAQDARSIVLAADENDYTFLREVLDGRKFLPYGRMTDEQLMGEYHDRHDRIEELIEDGELLYDLD